MIVNRLFSLLSKTTLLSLLVAIIMGTNVYAGDELHPPTDMRDLIVRLADNDRSIRTKAAYEFRLYGQSILPKLMKTYKTGTAPERRGSIVGISLLPTPGLGMDTLLKALSDDDVGTRSLAAQGLAIVGESAAPTLVALLGHDLAATRDAAGFSLKMMRGAAVPALIQGLDTNNEYARAKAAWLLGRMGEDARPAVPALINALDVANPRAMHVVAEAIDLIGVEPSTAIHHLVTLGANANCPTLRIGENAAPILVRLLARPGTQLGQLAFHSLARVGEPAASTLKAGALNGPIGKQVACALVLLEIDPSAADELPQDVLTAIRFAQSQPKQ